VSPYGLMVFRQRSVVAQTARVLKKVRRASMWPILGARCGGAV